MRAIGQLRFYTFVLHGSIPYIQFKVIGNRTHMILPPRPSRFQHRCQPSRNIWDSPGFGAPVPCPARNLHFCQNVPEILVSHANYN